MNISVEVTKVFTIELDDLEAARLNHILELAEEQIKLMPDDHAGDNIFISRLKTHLGMGGY